MLVPHGQPRIEACAVHSWPLYAGQGGPNTDWGLTAINLFLNMYLTARQLLKKM